MKLFRSKREKLDKSIENNVIAKLDGRKVKCVSKRNRNTYGETIVGKEGFINLNDGVLRICCGNDIVFTGTVDELQIYEFLSHNGVNIEGVNSEDGEKVHVVAYYSVG